MCIRDRGPVLKTGAVKTVVGSSPTASALHEGLMVQQEDARVACQPFFYLDRAGASPGESTFILDPVVQRQRLLVYTQKTMVRVHPGSFQLLIYACRFRIASNRKSTINNRKLHGSVGNWQTTLFQTQRCCGFESHSSYSSTRPRGAVRSARLSLIHISEPTRPY